VASWARWSSFRVTARRAAGTSRRRPRAKGPGVVVIQEWWGLTDHIKRVADRLATRVRRPRPDLYGGRIVEEPDEAGKAMMDSNGPGRPRHGGCGRPPPAHPQANRARSARSVLHGRTLAHDAGDRSAVEAVVDYYGGPLKGQSKPTRSRAPSSGTSGPRTNGHPLRSRELLDRLHRLASRPSSTLSRRRPRLLQRRPAEVYDPRAAALSSGTDHRVPARPARRTVGRGSDSAVTTENKPVQNGGNQPHKRHERANRAVRSHTWPGSSSWSCSRERFWFSWAGD